MTTPTPAPAPVVPGARLPAVRPVHPFRRFLRALLFLFVLAVASLFIPSVFQFALRQLLTIEAWRHGSRVDIDQLTGSFYEPVRLKNTRWIFYSHAGSIARVEIQDAEANFDWSALLPWHGGRWFNRVAVNGVTGKVEIPVEVKQNLATPSASPRMEVVAQSWWPAPAVVEAGAVDLTVLSGQNSIRIQESRWTVSEWSDGVVEAGQIVVKQPWLNRTFRNVRGTTALAAPSQIFIADLHLDKDVLIKSTTADVKKLATGVLKLDSLIQAFGGEIRVQAETLQREKDVVVSATTTFSNISVAALATFLGASEAAGGVVEEGKFNFRGAVADLPGSNSSLRFTARNFQWESRQWDSLVFGATLLNRRVQVPEFVLHQGQNELSANGEFALPRGDQSWWQTEFAMNIAARIDNLTDLSALLLPDFQYAAGKATIDGSIRGRDQQFHGQLLVSGSNLTYRKAPIQELHAAIRLNGNELQLANFDLINRDDYLHGRGVINILGAKQYWGEVRASVEDLAKYSSVLQKPLVPEPLAGGAVLSWTGEGSADRYSGTFFARLQKVRSLGKTGAQLHPVNAELEGAYAPGAVQFSRLSVADEGSSFSAKVQLGQKSVSFTDIQLKQGLETRLEGDALLPLDVWSTWPSGNLAQLLSEATPVQFKLKATNLRLGEALRLSGWNWPLDGGVTGEISGKGAGASLQMEGGLQLRDGKLPLGWNGDALSEVTADLTLSGHKLLLAPSYATHASGKYAANGEIDLENLRDPTLNLELASGSATVSVLPDLMLATNVSIGPPAKPLGLQVASKLALQLQGPAGKATISGVATVLNVRTASPFDLQSLWSASSAASPAFFGWANEPWSTCKLDVRCMLPKSERVSPWDLAAPNLAGHFPGEIHLTGTGANPEAEGTLTLSNPPRGSVLAVPNGTPEEPAPVYPLVARSNNFPLEVTAATITFRPGPIDPTVDFSFLGYLHGLPFHGSIIGPLSRRISFMDSDEAKQILLGLAPASGAEGLELPGQQEALARPMIFSWRAMEIPVVPASPTTGATEPSPAPPAVTPPLPTSPSPAPAAPSSEVAAAPTNPPVIAKPAAPPAVTATPETKP